MSSKLKVGSRILLGVFVLALLGFGIYSPPPVRARLNWRVAEWQAQIKFALSPPEEVVFLPQEPEAVSAPIVTPTHAPYQGLAR